MLVLDTPTKCYMLLEVGRVGHKVTVEYITDVFLCVGDIIDVVVIVLLLIS
jgi:hypothetical protein